MQCVFNVYIRLFHENCLESKMFGFVCLQTGPRVFECVFEKSDSSTLKIRDGNNINHNVESSELFFDEYFC